MVEIGALAVTMAGVWFSWTLTFDCRGVNLSKGDDV